MRSEGYAGCSVCALEWGLLKIRRRLVHTRASGQNIRLELLYCLDWWFLWWTWNYCILWFYSVLVFRGVPVRSLWTACFGLFNLPTHSSLPKGRGHSTFFVGFQRYHTMPKTILGLLFIVLVKDLSILPWYTSHRLPLEYLSLKFLVCHAIVQFVRFCKSYFRL